MTARNNTRLCDLLFKYHCARYYGNAGKYDRETNTRKRWHDLVMAVRMGYRTDCHRPQRDLINRRQFRASLAGVELYDRATVFGYDLGFIKWRNR